MLRLALTIAALLLAVPAGAGSPRVVAYEIVNASAIPDSLTGAPGDAEAGRLLFFDRALTRCSGCHGSPGGPGALIDRETGGAPNLAGVGSRLDEGRLRMWLVAPEVLSPGTVMPSYYRLGQRDEPSDPFYGETLLSAAEIEDIVAYLLRQKVP